MKRLLATTLLCMFLAHSAFAATDEVLYAVVQPFGTPNKTELVSIDVTDGSIIDEFDVRDDSELFELYGLVYIDADELFYSSDAQSPSDIYSFDQNGNLTLIGESNVDRVYHFAENPLTGEVYVAFDGDSDGDHKSIGQIDLSTGDVDTNTVHDLNGEIIGQYIVGLSFNAFGDLLVSTWTGSVNHTFQIDLADGTAFPICDPAAEAQSCWVHDTSGSYSALAINPDNNRIIGTYISSDFTLFESVMFGSNLRTVEIGTTDFSPVRGLAFAPNVQSDTPPPWTGDPGVATALICTAMS